MRMLIMFTLLFVQTVHGKSFNGFDLSNSLIDTKHILHGGPSRDGIPAISNPNYVLASDAEFMKPDDVVLGFKTSNQAFAYPRHILNWHELVNDQVEGKPFLISYCPLCGSGMAFSSDVGGKHLNFGVSGLLYNNDLLFYDRQTDSLWSQIDRRAISGDFVGTQLQQLVLEHTSWKAWRNKHPDSKVLSETQGFKRNYRHDPYTGYDTSSKIFFETLRDAPSEFHSKENVLGLTIGKLSKAYPFSELRKHGLTSFEDQLAGINYKVIWDAEASSATITQLDGDVLTTTVAYWFAWYNFHPDTQVFRAR